VLGNGGDELPCLLDVENGEMLSGLPWQIDVLCRVGQEKLLTNRLPKRREEDCMRVSNRARRQLSVQQLAVERLNLCRRRVSEGSCAQTWTDVPCEQTRVVAEALGAQSRSDAEVESVIEVLVECLPEGSNVAPKVSLREHAVEVSLCSSQRTENGLADVLRFRVSGSRPT
jgi:hypothetical protein